MADDRCPPHDFKAAWAKEDRGVLYCRYCGEILDLEPPRIEAPAEETIRESTHHSRES